MILNIKSIFIKYERSIRDVNKHNKEAEKFFSDFELDYSFTYCAGDGVMILDCESSLCGYISEEQLSALSKSKTRDQALLVLKSINFNC